MLGCMVLPPLQLCHPNGCPYLLPSLLELSEGMKYPQYFLGKSEISFSCSLETARHRGVLALSGGTLGVLDLGGKRTRIAN